MGTGIIICGLNGAGKSTLGRALAKEWKFHFIDAEDLYSSKDDPNFPYAHPRTRDEAETLLASEIKVHENFVFASVRGDYGEPVRSALRCAVLIDTPKEIRLRRVKERSYQKFGSRMLPGGDLYEQEEKFFDFVGSRTENTTKEWLETLCCPVIRVDGTKSVEENIRLITERLPHIRIADLFNDLQE